MPKGMKSVLVLAVLIMTFLIAGCGDVYVAQVRDGHMLDHPQVKVGQAFDNFFTEGQWSSFESKDQKRVVEFNGNAFWAGEPAKFTIQFVILDNGFRYNATRVDGDDINTFTGLAMLEKIFSEYENNPQPRTSEAGFFDKFVAAVEEVKAEQEEAERLEKQRQAEQEAIEESKKTAEKERQRIAEKARDILPGYGKENIVVDLTEVGIKEQEFVGRMQVGRRNVDKKTNKKVYAHKGPVPIHRRPGLKSDGSNIQAGFFYDYLDSYRDSYNFVLYRVYVGGEMGGAYVYADDCLLLDEDKVVGCVKVETAGVPIFKVADDDSRNVIGGAEQNGYYRLMGKYFSYNYHPYYAVLLNDGRLGFIKEADAIMVDI